VNRAEEHAKAVMTALRLGDVSAADAYLKGVKASDGRRVHDAICNMIAIQLRIPPLEL
jgi:hypothetical protein